MSTNDLAASLHAARAGLAVGPAQPRALTRATGKDARDYLHRMSTQAINPLAPGATALAAFLDAKGHLLGDAQVLVEAEAVLLDLDPLAAPATLALLEKLVIMDEVTFERLDGWVVVPVLGPRAAEAAAAAAPGAPRFANARRGVPAADLALSAAEAEGVRARLLAAGAVPVDDPALEALRIQGGFARYGLDMDASRLPMEAGLTRSAIDFGKGCYIGQEVVLRATARGHLQKGLVLLRLPAGAAPGAKLLAGGQEVGVVTSAAETDEGRLGLGYAKRACWPAGTALAVEGLGEATVVRTLVEEPAAKAGL